MKLIALHSQKGGVGKTTLSVNLSYLAMLHGFETLVIDLDPQGSASFLLGKEAPATLKAKKWAKNSIAWEDHIQASAFEGISLLSAHRSLRKMDLVLDTDLGSQHFRHLLKPLKTQFDLIVFDCPPGISQLTEQLYPSLNALVVPVTPTPLCLASYSDLLRVTGPWLTPRTHCLPVVNRYDARLPVHRYFLRTFCEAHQVKNPLLVRATTQMEKLGWLMRPVLQTHPNHPVCRDLTAIWKKLMISLDLYHL